MGAVGSEPGPLACWFTGILLPVVSELDEVLFSIIQHRVRLDSIASHMGISRIIKGSQ